MNEKSLLDVVSRRITELAKKAAIEVPSDVARALDDALVREEAALENHDPLASSAGRDVLRAIKENIDIAFSSRLPMCQDTGMFLVFCDVGRSMFLVSGDWEDAINDGLKKAIESVPYRRSVVSDPLFERTNTQNNLPAVFHWALSDGEGLRVSVLLKGFGSENCSGVRMLRPTDGPKEVVSAVSDIMRTAGGKPCPPVFLGIGLGGTMDDAARMSKRALLRDYGTAHPDSRYAELESQVLASVNRLGIGPGGLGGVGTALSVAIEKGPTHIAGLPLAVSVNCWADRKFRIDVIHRPDGSWKVEEILYA
ncbi:fumarate hydratase [Parasphaerochaeta coccoides]|uniref:Hydro-lyase, Fe-S type, tartrate/fumarate subfamily, alpha subunit n=1 Tax=Parasphaerochaeta coccoides (strain ATCC BAA-1237 / DSM 17374 / SPN1) TaxID=760011 RepID=F4GI49_PARC1|nr:fumarate hydratase [Parasphaerochaeta coccoides]AEC02647.1 hydro-lyase, Fe-S type, tartrate/fumarate subfamily, alpha subunit [Parasphaerochaeta coccoides DSM 17374]